MEASDTEIFYGIYTFMEATSVNPSCRPSLNDYHVERCGRGTQQGFIARIIVDSVSDAPWSASHK